MQPKISVIVNCLNGEPYLKEALDSIYAQTYSHWEIIFIDNASTDQTPFIIQAYDERLHYFRLDQTVPLYAARNYALKQAHGNFIAFLDVDDCWLPDKLTKQIAVMQAYPDIYLLSTGFFRQNDHLHTTTKHLEVPSGYLSFQTVIEKYPVNLSSVMLRNDEKIQSMLHFEEKLNLTGDYELFVKLIHQFKAYYIAEALLTTRIHKANLSAKLVRHWPAEVKETHARLIKNLQLSLAEQQLLNQRHIKNASLVHLAVGEYREARNICKHYWLSNYRIAAIYFATFNKTFARYLVKRRGF